MNKYAKQFNSSVISMKNVLSAVWSTLATDQLIE